ncbi:MAG: disulfide bond formation protein DsbA [Candidatus Harrisonbacteria bacterium CG10_big_fil_rev_8_21_14_0_10_42_17]|uniref:Disulfide bond formation protein DsbA n=1 Tax=Candidatus Harrisonbacteria bacterium CG10_big_fil_rev_8_21_14_0_10_42_17 TaxID=1974584 RepID=A0A2M6WJG9_9BACT|nr:MAG: disulfide bond formation protein DsbA [Candidatus Harrisonbacteria bacterium CG10_big_fil_rev_8_21_14_0_10_42_17]
MEHTTPSSKRNDSGSHWALPISIFLSALIIGGALVYNANLSPGASAQLAGGDIAPVRNAADSQAIASGSLREVSLQRDHILGNPNAPVKVIEYSDLECPYCATLHPTLEEIVRTYGNDVAWVYRHFPLSIHPGAQPKAEASECVAELGGNQAFWDFISELFVNQRTNESLDVIATRVGVDKKAFNECVTSGRHANLVQEDYDNAVATGGRGTPHSIIVDAKGNQRPVSGALPFDHFKTLIDQLLDA